VISIFIDTKNFIEKIEIFKRSLGIKRKVSSWKQLKESSQGTPLDFTPKIGKNK